jgi:hypothetical protein
MMIASERGAELKRRIVQINDLLERISKPPMVMSGRILARPMDGRMRAVQQQAGDVVRLVLAAWRQSESLQDVGPLVQALSTAALRLRPLINVLESQNFNNEAESIDGIIADIDRFVAGVKSGRIA